MTRTDELRDAHGERSPDPDQRARESSAVDRLLASLDGMDPFERIEALREAGKRKAEAEGRAYQLEHQRHVVLSRVAGQIAQAHAKQNMSEAKLERLARAHPDYDAHLRGTAAAIEEKELATVEYFAIKGTLEWLRATIYHDGALSRLEG